MQDRHIVIIGGGVVGVCTAYYLTRHTDFDQSKHVVTLIEASEIAGGASGKAGGCLAKWAQPAVLAASSFELHQHRAREHEGPKEWGFRKVRAADCDAAKRHDEDPDDNTPAPEDLDWLNHGKLKWYKPYHKGETAQVHPRLFTEALANKAADRGVRFVRGSVQSIDHHSDTQKVRAVVYQNQHDERLHHMPATDVVVAAGPWTSRLLPNLPIRGEKSHSIVIQTPRVLTADILFFDPGNLQASDPERQIEIYSRPGGELYACGQTDYGLTLPDKTEDVLPDLERCERILDSLGNLAPELKGSKVITKQACFRPMVYAESHDPSLGPLIGPTAVAGLWCVTGSNEWGINNGPICGKVMSELLLEGRASSADISSLDPRVFMTAAAQ